MTELRSAKDGRTIVGKIPWDTLNEDLGGHRAVLKPHSMQLPTVEPAKEILTTLIP